jgi:hypothetical protein
MVYRSHRVNQSTKALVPVSFGVFLLSLLIFSNNWTLNESLHLRPFSQRQFDALRLESK